MKNFNRGDRFGGRGRDRDQKPTMHQVTCSDCGKSCEVPFRPSGDRPVYCNTCFEKHSGSSSNRNQGGNYKKSGFGEKRMFDAVCAKCGKACEVPFRPTGDKPVYCSQCFDKGGNASSSKTSEPTKQQFEILNAKLDKILKALALTVEVSTVKESKPESKETKKQKNSKAKKTSAKSAVKKAKAKKK